MTRLQEIEARLDAIKNEIEQKGAELTAEQLTAYETEVNALKTERAGLVAAAEQRSSLLASIAEGRSNGTVVRSFPSPAAPPAAPDVPDVPEAPAQSDVPEDPWDRPDESSAKPDGDEQ